MQRGFAQLLLVVGVLVLLGVFGGYFYLKNGSAPASLISHPASTQSTEATYKSSEFNFEFKYPKGMVASADSEEEYSKRNNGDARKNFSGYVGYSPGKFLGAVYVAKDKASADQALFIIWVFENAENLDGPGWFSKYWYYPFMWGDFTYDGKLKLAPKDESTVSGQLVKSATVFYQEDSPKYIYIPKDGKMFLIRVLEKDKVGEKVLGTLKFLGRSDETANWKKYVSSENGYSIIYPNNWVTEENNTKAIVNGESYNVLEVRFGLSGQQDYQGKLYPRLSISVTRDPKLKNLKLEEFRDSLDTDKTKNYLPKDQMPLWNDYLLGDNYQARSVHFSNCQSGDCLEVIFRKDNTIYEFNKGNASEEDEFNKILASFRLLQ